VAAEGIAASACGRERKEEADEWALANLKFTLESNCSELKWLQMVAFNAPKI
jgi:hypothetical protein